MNETWAESLRRWGCVGALAGLLMGCETVDDARARISGREHVSGPGYQPENIHRLPAGVPERIRRVAVLPLAAENRSAQAEAGAEAMQAVLVAELTRAGAFEIIVVDEATLVHATGRPRWTAEEALPATFLQKLRALHACDAVLFSRLTSYRAYPPLALGWSFKLVECPEKPGTVPRILWAADETFDAGNAAVINSARRHYLGQQTTAGPLADSRTVLQSPRRFAQYTLSALALTLPPREISPQVPPPPADAPGKIKPVKPASDAGRSE